MPIRVLIADDHAIVRLGVRKLIELLGGDSITVMVTVSQEGHDGFRLDGWLAPAAALSIELRRSEASVSTSSDEDGRFVFDNVPPGLAQLVLHPTRGAAVELRQDVVAPAVQL